jgi:FemAB-related protein (PEP-CTERM system-associated)
VQVRQWTDASSWDAFVLAAGDGNVAHRWAWTRVIPVAYGHQVVPLAAQRAGRLVGVLPLVLVRSRLFGRVLVSMPYLDSGGLCTDGDSEADSALLAAAIALADSEGVRLELRHLGERSIGLPASLHKVTMTVDLTGGQDAVWSRARPNRRGQVRKARRAGLECVLTGESGVGDFYRVLAHNMRDLGSPVHRRRFFTAVSSELGDDATYVLVRSGSDVVGAGLLLFHGQRAVLPFSSSLRAARSLGPNQLLYWETVRCAVDRGCTILDLGRSSPGSGTFEAKREWGATPVQLYWHRAGADQPAGGPDDLTQRLAWATRLWSRLPVRVATGASSLIRGGLPQ